jgi:hypothetical protein
MITIGSLARTPAVGARPSALPWLPPVGLPLGLPWDWSDVADLERAAVIEETAVGSYDDEPEAGVHVILAVPLLAPAPTTAPPRPAPAPASVPSAGPARRRAQHARRQRSVVRETIVLGVTAAIVVLAGVVILLALVDWLD